ncbi:sensor histidine kinase [Chitinophaga nivalis]|uniref:Histidine kinase n=1 Tax=Chitinophaga nivalis TaxID=2991709 RepID=A0ABT3IH09_9BACT|nr:histidine kinase [Chitinophaga nivalis]MCW3467081.1 histidine kinase [Chitinophaga nivalis]MCW3483228.1 histidine kinase [Chitinophaga nivalis]
MPFIEKIVSFSTRHRVLAHLLFWLGFYMLSISQFDRWDPSHPYGESFLKPCIDGLFYLTFSMMATYFLTYRILPAVLKSHNYILVTLELIVGSYLICVYQRIVVVHVMEPIVRTPPFSQESIGEILIDLPKLFRSYFLHTFSISIIFIFIKLIKDQYLANKLTLEQEKQKAEIELKSLKAQLNPHFLFNTLNNIYSLSLMNSPQTSASIARLSAILDHLLYRCGDLLVPVSHEITLLQNYIELEKLRYDDRLLVSFQHEMDRDARIAPLILLSLVENAFKHGAGEDIGSPFIRIELSLRDHHFHFNIKNTFLAVREKDDSLKIGLANIRKQLELIYPNAHRIETRAGEGIFTVDLQLFLKDA